jgi:hypothetical protein
MLLHFFKQNCRGFEELICETAAKKLFTAKFTKSLNNHFPSSAWAWSHFSCRQEEVS